MIKERKNELNFIYTEFYLSKKWNFLYHNDNGSKVVRLINSRMKIDQFVAVTSFNFSSEIELTSKQYSKSILMLKKNVILLPKFSTNMLQVP